MATKKAPAKKTLRTASTPGPKPRFGEDASRTGMLLSEMTRRKANVLGDGNVSEGVRIAVDRQYDAYQKA